jgi:hypothetical protein
MSAAVSSRFYPGGYGWKLSELEDHLGADQWVL